MRKPRPLGLGLGLGLTAISTTLLGLPARAHAEEADSHRRALQAFSEGRYELALTLFSSGFAETKKPEYLIRMGQTYLKLGRPREAQQACQGFLDKAEAPDPVYRGYAEQCLADARRAGAGPLPAAPSATPAPSATTAAAPESAPSATTPSPSSTASTSAPSTGAAASTASAPPAPRAVASPAASPAPTTGGSPAAAGRVTAAPNSPAPPAASPLAPPPTSSRPPTVDTTPPAPPAPTPDPSSAALTPPPAPVLPTTAAPLAPAVPAAPTGLGASYEYCLKQQQDGRADSARTCYLDFVPNALRAGGVPEADVPLVMGQLLRYPDPSAAYPSSLLPRYEERRNDGMWGAGLAMWLTAWVPALIFGPLDAERFRPFAERADDRTARAVHYTLMVPVLGPFISGIWLPMVSLNRSDAAVNYSVPWIVADGITQLVGFSLFVSGYSKRRVAIRPVVGSAGSVNVQSLRLAPYATGDVQGVALSGRF